MDKGEVVRNLEAVDDSKDHDHVIPANTPRVLVGNDVLLTDVEVAAHETPESV